MAGSRLSDERRGTISPRLSRLSRFRFGGAGFLVIAVPAAAPPAWLGGVTTAERAVLALVARGLTNVDIAAARRCTTPTVAKQIASLQKKIGSVGRTGLVTAARHALPLPE